MAPIELRQAKGLEKYFGLMFRSPNTSALLFEFEKETDLPIHSYFVFFPFTIIWYDAAGNIIEKRVVTPWQRDIKPSKPFKSFIEIPQPKDI